jgi:hypothetical protein
MTYYCVISDETLFRLVSEKLVNERERQGRKVKKEKECEENSMDQ